MSLRIIITFFFYSATMLASGNCLDQKSLKPMDCLKTNMIDRNISDWAALTNTLPSTQLNGNFKLSDTKLQLTEKSSHKLEMMELELPKYLNSMNRFDYRSFGSVETDVKFNIVYETFVSVTYEPWNEFWVVDHFMFEYITDKYRNAFAMLTLKINIL